MKLYVDLATLQLIEGPGFRTPANAIRFKRGDAANLQVVFLTNGQTPAVIGDPATLELQFGVKARGRYDLGYLVHEAAWTMPDPEPASPVYQCTPDFNTVELNAAMGVDSPTGAELPEVTLMGEITWREGNGPSTSTRTFQVIVENDVNRGTEGVPTDANPAYPLPGSIALLSSVVRHDAAQSLTAGQKTQARANMGLGSAATSAATAFAAADHDHDKIASNYAWVPYRIARIMGLLTDLDMSYQDYGNSSWYITGYGERYEDFDLFVTNPPAVTRISWDVSGVTEITAYVDFNATPLIEIIYIGGMGRFSFNFTGMAANLNAVTLYDVAPIFVASDIDDFINALAQVVVLSNGVLDLSNSYTPRTTASDVAVGYLVSTKNWTVIDPVM